MDATVHRAVRAPASPPGRSRRRWTALSLIGVLSLNACYSTRYLTGAPSADTRVVLELNDQGRLAYGERIGPSVREVEGMVTSANDSAYAVRIMSVRYLDGRQDRWAGEPFEFSRSHLSRAEERELSTSRTTLMSAVVAGGAALLFVGAKLIGGAQGGGTSNGGKNPPAGS